MWVIMSHIQTAQCVDRYSLSTLKYTVIKPEPNMLRILLIIPFRTSQKIPIILHIITYFSHIIFYALLFQVLTSRETWT